MNRLKPTIAPSARSIAEIVGFEASFWHDPPHLDGEALRNPRIPKAAPLPVFPSYAGVLSQEESATRETVVSSSGRVSSAPPTSRPGAQRVAKTDPVWLAAGVLAFGVGAMVVGLVDLVGG